MPHENYSVDFDIVFVFLVFCDKIKPACEGV